MNREWMRNWHVKGDENAVLHDKSAERKSRYNEKSRAEQDFARDYVARQERTGWSWYSSITF